MVLLEDTIRIDKPLTEVADWLLNMPANYIAWHPKDHISFRSLTNDVRQRKGSRAELVELVGTFKLAFTFVVTEVQATKMTWRAVFPHSLGNLGGEFYAHENKGMTEITTVTYYGWPIPLIGPFMDWIVDAFFIKRSIAERHMREESEYLKAAIESQQQS